MRRPPDDFGGRGFQREAAIERHGSHRGGGRQVTRQSQRPGVVQILPYRVARLPAFDDRLGASRHFDHTGGDLQPADRFRQPFVVSEDDHLSGPCRHMEHAGQAIHLARVHRLDRIVDDDEAEG